MPGLTDPHAECAQTALSMSHTPSYVCARESGHIRERRARAFARSLSRCVSRREKAHTEQIEREHERARKGIRKRMPLYL